MAESEEDRIYLDEVLRNLTPYDEDSPTNSRAEQLACFGIAVGLALFWIAVVAVGIALATRH